jgi:hypothetical protein
MIPNKYYRRVRPGGRNFLIFSRDCWAAALWRENERQRDACAGIPDCGSDLGVEEWVPGGGRANWENEG